MEQFNEFASSLKIALSTYGETIIPVAVFVVVTATALICWRIAKRRAARRTAAAADGNAPDDLFTSLAPALAAQLPESAKGNEDFDKMLREAGLYSPDSATKVYATRFLLFITPLLIAGCFAVYRAPHGTYSIMLTGVFVSALLSIVPRLYVFFRRRRRLASIRDGLPDAIDMLAMCMEGGISVGESLTQVASRLDNYPPLAQELMILRRQADVGSLNTALTELSKRVDLPEVRGLCTLLSRGDRLGTEVSGSLLEQSDYMRTQRRQRATMRANRAPVKLVLPMVLCFAPAAMIMLLSPAVLELHDFLVPSGGDSVLTARDQMSDTSAIVEQLRSLDQNAQP